MWKVPIYLNKSFAIDIAKLQDSPILQEMMRPTKDTARRRARHSSPPRSARATSTSTAFPSDPDSSLPRSRQSTLAPSASLLDREQQDTFTLFEDLRVSQEHSSSSPEPRSFPYSVKQQCWEKAEKVKGRDADRWRRDPLGNIVFRKLVGCPGCLCHDYDHIVPYSKILWCGLAFMFFHGAFSTQLFVLSIRSRFIMRIFKRGGKSTLENCQVLQATVNRSKGNKTELSRADLIQRSSYCRVSGRDMDLIELSAYGNVRHVADSGGCRIQ